MAFKKIKQENCDHMIRRKKTKLWSRSDFSTMHPDLLDKIVNCLEDFKDKIVFKHTCSSWFSVAKSNIKCLLDENKQSSPMLFVSGSLEEETNNDGFVFDLEEKLQKPLLHNFPLTSSCIGSSGGWLLFLESFENLFIFHHILGVKISLPPINSFPGVNAKKSISKHWINKFILWGDPILEKDYGVAVIYGSWHTKLAFFKHGDSKWANLGSDKNYSDIICHDGFIYALTNSAYIEKYNITGIPKKVMKIKPLSLNNITEFKQDDFRDLYFSQYYLVESKDSLLLVIRCIGKYVYIDGEVISEGDLIDDPYNQFSCPYKTTNFYVYKLNMEKTIWEELSSLDDQMLFIGGNHSFSLSAKNCVGCNENSIYFTDDNWEEITLAQEQDEDFGGHDIGVFNLKDKRFEDIYVSDTGIIDSSFWILQH
ncbi:hypothetical protein LIER_03193 [Lithospermum erythrorhizon]|uniref:KIB1-4 beta-propeller domain-containing protein n=1 Tax=Lithospermum erythrorhizon TaxID=34254 RepID=A0AAV3NTS2_LITER